MKMTEGLRESLPKEEGSIISPTRHFNDVIIERIANIQESIRNLSARFDKWEGQLHEQERDHRGRDEGLVQFKSSIEGAIKGVSATVKVLAWVLTIIQVVIIGWVGSVNLTTHNLDNRVEKMEVQSDLVDKSRTERSASIDIRLNNVDAHLAHSDADIDALKLSVDRLTRQTTPKGK